MVYREFAVQQYSMSGDASGGGTPTRKRPRSQQAATKRRRPPLGNRPPSGRLSQIRAGLENTEDKPETNLRSFTDLIGAGRSRAEQFLGEDAPDDAWASITNTVDNLGSASNLPTVIENDDASKIVYDADSRAFSEQLERDENVSESTFDKVLLDLSLKTKIDVVSSSSLQWALRRRQGDEYNALMSVMGEGIDAVENGFREHSSQQGHRGRHDGPGEAHENPAVEQEILNSKKRLYKALLHCRCPGESLPGNISARWRALISNYGRASWQAQAINEDKKFAVNRLINWQSALQSLYFGYRYGHVPEFYVLLASTTVIFNKGKAWAGNKHMRKGRTLGSSTTTESSSCFRASFAKASTGLRALMSEHEVPFTLVERPSGFDDPGVVVEGEFAVHALFNFLLALGPTISNASDVPVLVSDKPFRGCTIVSAEVLNARQMLIPGKAGEDPQHRYTLQIAGIFTPRQIRGICDALSIIQRGDFAARFETDPMGSMLNNCGHGGESSEGDEGDEDKLRLRGPLILSRIQMTSLGEGFSVTTRGAK